MANYFKSYAVYGEYYVWVARKPKLNAFASTVYNYEYDDDADLYGRQWLQNYNISPAELTDWAERIGFEFFPKLMGKVSYDRCVSRFIDWIRYEADELYEEAA